MRGWLAYAVLCGAALALTRLAAPSTADYFGRVLGTFDPMLATVAASVAGAGALVMLRSRFGFRIFRGRTTLRGIGVSALLASGLGLAIIVADVFIRYPQDLNAPMPAALLYYPAIGFVAEIAFHVVPLAALLLAGGPLASRLGRDRLVWLAIAIVAIVEPTFQVLFDGTPLAWPDLYTWVHVGAIAGLQLYVFRRYDFTSMYVFRLIYYAYWHVLWGVIRLEVLF